ncbi:hypothetical protein ACFUKR_20650 [Bacillus velezensis]
MGKPIDEKMIDFKKTYLSGEVLPEVRTFIESFSKSEDLVRAASSWLEHYFLATRNFLVVDMNEYYADIAGVLGILSDAAHNLPRAIKKHDASLLKQEFQRYVNACYLCSQFLEENSRQDDITKRFKNLLIPAFSLLSAPQVLPVLLHSP